jgi:predicted  nucleic acid-binding Zn-ribbon protein
MRWLIIPACALLPYGILSADGTAKEPAPKSPAVERSLDSLKTIAEPLATALSELPKLQEELKQAATEDAKQEIQTRIDEERERIRQLRDNFRDIIGGSEAAEYDTDSAESAGIQEQISELIQPVLSEIRDATSEPRELDALRKFLDKWEERKKKADTVLGRIDRLIENATDKALTSELDSARDLWASRQAEAISQIAVSNAQFENHARKQRSLWETLSTGFSRFFRSRGMNLLLALLAAVIGFIGTRKIYSWFRHISPIHKSDRHNFTSRISDVLAMMSSVLVALGGVIIVFYTRGDWLLLTLVVIFLVGVAWAGKTAIPPYLEQIRMILNLGSVREGERVIYEGLPWKVSALGFFTTFTNPRLEGGLMRIPIRDVMGMISRPIAKKEVWFPTEADDWILLSDGTYGKTITQTPDQVVVLQLGGSMKTYPTADFLRLSPENLSHGFRLGVTFGIDYQHQADCTDSIPGIFNDAVTQGMSSEFGRDAIRSIKTEFASAASSSLDYSILADFDGSVAHRYRALQRRIQSICVDVCNENGWVIPFTQITVHQAEA